MSIQSMTQMSDEVKDAVGKCLREKDGEGLQILADLIYKHDEEWATHLHELSRELLAG